MKFDRTFIAIRKRNQLEILDLSLHVIRDHWKPLLALWLIGFLPFAMFNGFILFELGSDSYDQEHLWLYCLLMAVLINSQSQVATVFMTVYLGKAMFAEQTMIWDTVQSILKTNRYFIWTHGGLRLLIPIMFFAFLIKGLVGFDSLLMLTVLICLLALIGILIRYGRPFANEILTLEKTPVFSKDKRKITYAKRSRILHSDASADITGRALNVALYSVPLFGCAMGTLITIDSALSLHSNSEVLPLVTYFPIALWMVVGFCAVVRYLSYIDIRIRQEGWEVELRVRAEAQRLEQMVR